MTKDDAEYVTRVLVTLSDALAEITQAVAFSARELGKREVDSLFILEVITKSTQKLVALNEEWKLRKPSE